MEEKNSNVNPPDEVTGDDPGSADEVKGQEIVEKAPAEPTEQLQPKAEETEEEAAGKQEVPVESKPEQKVEDKEGSAPTEKPETKDGKKEAPPKDQKKAHKSVSSKTNRSSNDPSSEKKGKPERKFDIPKEIEEKIANLDLKALTKLDLVQMIITRHETVIKDLLVKIKENKEFIDKHQPLMDEEKKKRDKINDAVSKLKEQRQAAQSETKKLRETFFSLIERDTDVSKITKELNVYKRYMEDIDWKLQTSAITLDKERQLIEEIKESMGKIHDLSKDIQESQGIKDKVKDISKKIDEGFSSAEEFHKTMLEHVSESEGHHEKWAELRKQVREKARQSSWMEHRMKMHSDNLTYWQGEIEKIKKEMLKPKKEKKKADKKEDKPKKEKKKPEPKVEEKPEPKVEEKKEEEKPKEESTPDKKSSDPPVSSSPDKEKPEEPKVEVPVVGEKVEEKPEPKMEEKPEPKVDETPEPVEPPKPEGGESQ